MKLVRKSSLLIPGFYFSQKTNKVISETLMKFNFGTSMIPHPDKAYKGGEDAYCADQDILSVADGVGGWADQGVDPGLYSKELCQNVMKNFQSNKELYSKDTKKLFVESAKQTKAVGSSTLVISTLDQVERKLNTAFMGDSKYLILRQNQGQEYQIVHESQSQQHQFNFPFQIGTHGDSPNNAVFEKKEIQKNDIVILGTDGLFDNLFVDQITLLLNNFVKSNEFDGNKISNILAQEAHKIGKNDKVLSPFGAEARKYGYRFSGGKLDDITVIVAKIDA